MPGRVEDLETSIRNATSPGFRGRLLARGEARDMIWREGVLPEDAPQFEESLSEDLLAYGYALLEHGLELTDANGSDELARRAFEFSATAIESVIVRGPSTSERGFHRFVAAAGFHLARFSARAYSLLHTAQEDSNTSPIEQCLVLLMMRDLRELTRLVSRWRAHPDATDEHLTEQLRMLLEPMPATAATTDPEEPTFDVLDVVDVALTDAFMGAISMAMLAFERGEEQLLFDAVARLQVGMQGSSTLGMVPQWWCHRLAIYLLRGLWQASFHQILPHGPSGDESGEWDRLRATFIASLLSRPRAEIDLWPSQLEAASRVLDTHENIVLSLPTSAGKTRIAELCILATLSEGKRVVFVTPLRALSAQTEAVLERTFIPLGKTISTLYGTIGVSEIDENILQDRDIVVSTPEKLDFALRNDASILDDVGLIVFDEGHMIGMNEREVRYEVQVHRLLNRSDADTRRIICLSAILPDGDQVQDFVGWLTDDQPRGLISSDWRPTTLRFGEVTWNQGDAKLNITVGGEEPYVPRFLVATEVPSNRRRTKFPNNQPELTLATAWRLVEDGQTVLVYCPQKSSVTSLAKVVVKLYKQGALESVFDGDPVVLQQALTIGQEWFPADHPILKCLQLGVAIHHGSLPGPYRKEIERLLQEGILKVTISSPTLAQGLNLAASTLVMHSLWRYGSLIEASEFRNIVGRAGRAFVDSSGLIVHPMFEPSGRARSNWENLVQDSQLRDMQSGLTRLTYALLKRMAQSLKISDISVLSEYVMGNANWQFPEIDDEDPKARNEAEANWDKQVASLDCALFGLLIDTNADSAELAAALDAALSSSLWARTVAHYQEPVRQVLRAGLVSRAALIWSGSTPEQRIGYYLAGVGYQTGQVLDAHAADLNEFLHVAEAAIELGVDDAAITALVSFSRIVLNIVPFAPKSLPMSWENILEGWLLGKPLTDFTSDENMEVVDFIEGTLAYRLPWALEAVRVRATVQPMTGIFLLDEPDFYLGLAVAAVETGTLNRSAALLMRTGFASRAGAIAAVSTTGTDFTSLGELWAWLGSELVMEKEQDENWPSPTTHDLWLSFTAKTSGSQRRTWVHEMHHANVTWNPGYEAAAGTAYRAMNLERGETILETADAQRVGVLDAALNPHRCGLLVVTDTGLSGTVQLSYRGPSDLYL